MVNGELLSPDEGTARLGVQDVAAERARIKEARSLDRVTKIVAVASQAASAGLNIRQVLIEAGIAENDIEAWIQSDVPTNVEQ
jgi:choline dehydrogenase-like flavoprotein